MGRGFAFGSAVPGMLVLAAPGGMWVCTFPNGETTTIKARAGKQGVSHQRNDEDAHNLWINNTDDGGITAHRDGRAWTLTPKDGVAVLEVDSLSKGETYKAACISK